MIVITKKYSKKMNRIKALFSTILIAILGTVAASCGSDKEEPITGVTLAGSWVTDQKVTSEYKFQYGGEERTITSTKTYVKFEPINKFTPQGEGKIVYRFLHGPVEFRYVTFHWVLDKSDINNIKTIATIDGTDKVITLYRTKISEQQLSFAMENDPTDEIPYERNYELDWAIFNQKGEEFFIERDKWEEDYANYLKMEEMFGSQDENDKNGEE